MSCRGPLGVLSISCALASCAATLPVGTVEGRAGSRSSGPIPTPDELGASTRVHRVKAGETLWRIAQNNGTTVDRLMELNGISDPTGLQVDVELKLPSEGDASASDALVRARALAHGKESSPPPKPEPKPRPVDSLKSPHPAATEKKAPAKKSSKRVTVARYPLRWPVRGTIARRFGRRGKKHHDGIDIVAGSGTPVAAAASGKVVFADEHGGYGKLILLRHASGLITVYAHQSELMVKKGQSVRGGDVISRVGASGSAKSPHLHFEVRKGVETKNPLQFLPP